MIDKTHGEYWLICDICAGDTGLAFEEFYDAVEAKKDLGWLSKKDTKKGWQDICPNCQESEGE